MRGQVWNTDFLFTAPQIWSCEKQILRPLFAPLAWENAQRHKNTPYPGWQTAADKGGGHRLGAICALMFDGLPELLEPFKEVTRARKQNSGDNGRKSAGQEEGLPVRRIFFLSFHDS